MEIKTEADSDDMTECPHDEQPSTCTFFSDFTVQAFHYHSIARYGSANCCKGHDHYV